MTARVNDELHYLFAVRFLAAVRENIALVTEIVLLELRENRVAFGAGGFEFRRRYRLVGEREHRARLPCPPEQRTQVGGV